MPNVKVGETNHSTLICADSVVPVKKPAFLPNPAGVSITRSPPPFANAVTNLHGPVAQLVRAVDS